MCQLDYNLDEINNVYVTHVLNIEYRDAFKSLVGEYKPQKMRETKLKMIILIKNDEPVYQRARQLSLIEKE
jgi:hypothetical protein